MKTNERCILIYNPISGHGHLDSWNALFVALLLKQGWNVLALTPDVPALMSRLAEKDLATSANLQILQWNAHSASYGFKEFLRRIWQRWYAFSDRYFYRRSGSEVHQGMSFFTYWRVRLYQWTIPFMYRVSRLFLTLYRRRHAFSASAGVSIDPEQDMVDPRAMATRTKAALKSAKWKPRLALNMYVDTYAKRAEKWSTFVSANSLPWVGICFVPSEDAREGWYASYAFVGMFFLDEDVCLRYRKMFPALQFEYLPDVTEIGLPTSPSALAAEVHRLAAGRIIIFLGGSIGGQKNLARWFEVIALADPARWFFVQVGEIHRSTLTAEDLVALERAQKSPPENLLLHEGYLPDERAFNDLIAACDLIFAVYRDFRISSNMLGKAAHFCKPILVSDRYLMGKRVRQYRIGKTVPEDDATAILEGMEEIAAQPVKKDNFEHYKADFSIQVLETRLKKMFNAIFSTDNSSPAPANASLGNGLGSTTTLAKAIWKTK